LQERTLADYSNSSLLALVWKTEVPVKQLILITLAAAALMAADATGKWTGTLTVTTDEGTPKPGGAYLVLKQEGNKLTGTAGPAVNEQRPLQNGKTEGGKITFELATGPKLMRFTLQHEGDVITGDVTQEHGGETRTAKLAVKREGP
jgi:hypothetical protein